MLHCRCMFGSNRFRKQEINYREEEKKILDSVMGPEVYDKRIRPSGLNSTGKKSSNFKPLPFQFPNPENYEVRSYKNGLLHKL